MDEQKDFSPRKRQSWAVCVSVFSLLVTLSVVCAGGVYVYQTEQRIGQLEKANIEFDASSQRENGETRLSQKDSIQERIKRQIDFHVETDHGALEYPGVPSSMIALIYGDTAYHREVMKLNESRLQLERLEKAEYDYGCHSVMRDKLTEEYWCYTNSDTQSDRFMTALYNHRYPHFKMAPWMNTTSSYENYKFTSEGNLLIKKTGLYILYANVMFADVGQGDRPGYGVYKTTSQNDEQLISFCFTSDLGYGTSCQTSQLVSLTAGDEVYMKIQSYVWIELKKENFNLALIMLNNESLF